MSWISSLSNRDIFIRIESRNILVSQRSKDNSIMKMIERWFDDWKNCSRIAEEIIKAKWFNISDEYWRKIVSEIVKNYFGDKEILKTRAISSKTKKEIAISLNEGKKPKEIGIKFGIHPETIWIIARKLESEWAISRKSQVEKIHEYMLAWKSREEVCDLLWKEKTKIRINLLKENYRVYKNRHNI